MSGKPRVRFEDLFRGAMELGLDSWKNGRTIDQELESKNGSGHADMDYVIYKGNEDLFWQLRRERSRLDKNRPPCTKAYIDAYDRKASEYGMPSYRCS
jgi:hypothetical protein